MIDGNPAKKYKNSITSLYEMLKYLYKFYIPTSMYIKSTKQIELEVNNLSNMIVTLVSMTGQKINKSNTKRSTILKILDIDRN